MKGANEAHLFYISTEIARDHGLLRYYETLLAPAERTRRDRYVFERNRHEVLITRGLVRTVLSRFAPTKPEDWQFTNNAYGRPLLPAEAGLQFNLSNTDGMVACVVARQGEVGVDVEATNRPGQTLEIAERFFSPFEVEALLALPADEQREAFFRYWTLKEAYIKARGMGLHLPLDRFSFLIEEGVPVRIELAPELGDDASHWHFTELRVSPRHQLALAIRGDADQPPQIRIEQIFP